MERVRRRAVWWWLSAQGCTKSDGVSLQTTGGPIAASVNGCLLQDSGPLANHDLKPQVALEALPCYYGRQARMTTDSRAERTGRGPQERANGCGEC